jgi:hypothetical protein
MVGGGEEGEGEEGEGEEGITENFEERQISNCLIECAVGIATCYALDDCGVGVRVPVGSRIFSKSPRPILGSTQPPIQSLPGALSPGVKRPRCEADHSLPASVEVKKMSI